MITNKSYENLIHAATLMRDEPEKLSWTVASPIVDDALSQDGKHDLQVVLEWMTATHIAPHTGTPLEERTASHPFWGPWKANAQKLVDYFTEAEKQERAIPVEFVQRPEDTGPAVEVPEPPAPPPWDEEPPVDEVQEQ